MTTPSRVVGRRIREVRKRLDLTAEQLAAKCRELGAEEFTESKINNLETRQRRITVEELLILARALDVAPVNLVIPPRMGADEPYTVAPRSALGAGRVRQWFRGIFPWPGGDRHTFMTESPVDEWPPPPGAYNPVGLDKAEILADLAARDGDDGER